MATTIKAQDKPFYSSEKAPPEITIKAIILGIILTVVLAGANTYLGLKVGMTISASIPASVIALGILRFFPRHNILESNIVQTTASSGEALAAGMIFTLPALIIVKYWFHFHYWDTVFIALTGGILGVLFSIPLRRILLSDKTLPFPEGVAIGSVLKVSTEKGSGLKYIVYGGLIGAIINFCQGGLQIFSDALSLWIPFNNSLFGFGCGFDAAVIGAGYIVGIVVGFSVLVGAVVGWVIGIPILSVIFGLPHGINGNDAAMYFWTHYLRFIGVGTLSVGGFWTLISLIKPIFDGLKTSMKALHVRRTQGAAAIPRTERDIPINMVFYGVAVLSIAVLFLMLYFIDPKILGISEGLRWSIAIFNVFYLIIIGFIFAAVCGYFAGLVGSSSSPISGLIIAAILIISLLLLPLFHLEITFIHHAKQLKEAVSIAIVVAALTGGIAAIANDNLQDLKAGLIIGATPWKQQLVLILGVVVASFVIPLILELLFNAYGIGGVYPRPNMDPSQMLVAPQAALIAAIAKGVFGHDLSWMMLIIGGVIAILTIILDSFLKKKNLRLPVLAVGFGIYLPLFVSMPLVIGSFVSYLVHRKLDKAPKDKKECAEQNGQKCLTLACGLVAGAAIMGIVLAIPAVIYQSSTVLSIVTPAFTPYADVLSVLVTFALCYWIYRLGVKGL